MATVPNGVVVTYVGKWRVGLTKGIIFSRSPDGVVSDVSQSLAAVGLPVRSVETNAGIVSTLGGDFTVTLHLQVENGFGFGSPDDIIAVIRHAVYDSLGHYPDSDTIPYVQTPVPGQVGAGVPMPTGQPAPSTAQPGEGCIAGTSHDLTGVFSFGCWWTNLTQKGFATVGILSIIALAGLFLFLLSFRGTVSVPPRQET